MTTYSRRGLLMDEKNGVILRMVKINKEFSGVSVLKDVDFELKRGEIHAIVGQNGAGKSVMMKILSGVWPSSSGDIVLEGQKVKYSSTLEARKLGIAMIYQEFSLVPSMTVAQNIFLNREPRNGMFIDDRTALARSREILSGLGVEIDPKEMVRNLNVTHKQIVEIGKVVSQDRKIIIMDEPTASLPHEEIVVLHKAIRQLKQKGISIVYISHHLNEVFDICDRVTVLRDGQRILTDETGNLQMATLIEAMLGKKIGEEIPFDPAHSVKRGGVPRLEVKNLDLGGKGTISFQLWPGEALGFAGLLGAGQDRIVDAVFGVANQYRRELRKDGKAIRIRSASDAMSNKITMVPLERQLQGLVLGHSVKANICMSILKKLHRGRLFLDDRAANETVGKYIRDMNIITESPNKLVKFLSGGNQQKVVLSKNLATEPEIMILNDPNFGVDIGSKIEILKLIRRFVEAGGSVIFISSEFSELAKVCDRVLIVKNSLIVDQFVRDRETSLIEGNILQAVQ
jgi:ribose transport system ATP-binding protein